jgi:hypothetical protein
MSMFREQLILRALAALCEIADECGDTPAPKSLSLRFILAYTFVAAGSDPKLKWIWNNFWENATAQPNAMKPLDDYLRGTGARTALTGICREIGYSPDPDLFEMLRDQRRSPKPRHAEEPSRPHANDEPSDDNAA